MAERAPQMMPHTQDRQRIRHRSRIAHGKNHFSGRQRMFFEETARSVLRRPADACVIKRESATGVT